MLSEKKKRKRKMWSKKWYLKRNISCDAHLLNGLLETDVPWDDAIVVSAGKLRKLWDSRSELRSSLCERRLDRTVLMPALLPVITAQFTQVFCQVWGHTVKSLSLTESVQGALQSCIRFVLTSVSHKRRQSWIKSVYPDGLSWSWYAGIEAFYMDTLRWLCHCVIWGPGAVICHTSSPVWTDSPAGAPP